MGYYATLFEGELIVPGEKIEAAQTALGVEDLEQTLNDNGFDVMLYEDDLIVEMFDSKWRSEVEDLLRKIAPFVNDTVLGFRGEDGDLWAFEYRAGVVDEKVGRVVWS